MTFKKLEYNGLKMLIQIIKDYLKYNFLSLSGGTINGQLTINKDNGAGGGGLRFNGTAQNYSICISDTSVTKGSVPSSTHSWGIDFYGKDVNDYTNRIGMLETALDANNVASTFIRAYNCTTNTNASQCSIGVHVDGSGNFYTSAPTPASGDNSTKIATTAFVNSYFLPKSGGTVTGTLILSRTTDASGTASNSPALIVGGAETAAHMELDADEIMAKTNGTSVKAIYMNNDGGAVYICNAATGVYLNASNGFLPRTTKKLTLGGASNLWTTVYASTATISTSDKRLKDLINNISDDVLDVWDKVNWQQFKMKDSISEKGIENARLHTGLVAQDVEKVFNDNNLDPRKYGFFCFDKWDDEDAVYSASGKLMQEAKEAGESFSIRYEEALCIEAAYQRRKIKLLEDRIKILEEKINENIG